MSPGTPLPYGYSWTQAPRPAGRVSTSRRELYQIGGAFAILTLDIVLLLAGTGFFVGTNSTSVDYNVSLTVVVVAAAAAFTGFVAHELAHKIVAQRRGYWAEFRWSIVGLAVSVFTAIIGFLWAAPGATVVSGMSDSKEWGHTALAGPSINLVFGGMFYAASLATWYAGNPLFGWLLILAFLNCWFAAFNLVPWGILDGAKVFHWNRGAWAGSMALAAGLAGISWLAVFIYGSPLLHF
ncbi:MAG: M50 family metallopeptidase [Thermoplasmata archaeon]